MKKIKSLMKRFVQAEAGVTSLEYGVLGVLVVTAIGTAVTSLDLDTAFTAIATAIAQ